MGKIRQLIALFVKIRQNSPHLVTIKALHIELFFA
jgi:hypothetical protein